MLKHKRKSSSGEKVLVLGSQGFIGKKLIEALTASDFKVEGVSSKDIDLIDPKSVAPLAEKIMECDHVVMLSCLTPDKGKGTDVLMQNLFMAKHVCDALKSQEKLPHVVYFSSDSVYSFEDSLIHEGMLTSPSDLYGAMHRMRELMFLEVAAENLAIMRPTLVYGSGDSHNSYGPNRFRREAFKEKSITLFGAGEDTRAHIYIDDLVKLTILILENNSVGTLNAAPDESITYGSLADLISSCSEEKIEIKSKPRAAEPNHRYFETTRCYEAFPGFKFTPLKEGVSKVHEMIQKNMD